ncbi:MAG TPA: hypothetical protein DCO86_01595 [Spirochaetaceae bacterium]|nr:hypothetical protein [Spirochaetaceae bacterium]
MGVAGYDYGGKYKTNDNVIMEIDEQVSRRISKANRVESAVMNSLIPLSKAEICGMLPDVSQTTVEAVLSDMV